MLMTKQIRLHDWQLKWLKKQSSKKNVKSSSMIRYAISLIMAGKCGKCGYNEKNFEDIEFLARKKSAS